MFKPKKNCMFIAVIQMKECFFLITSIPNSSANVNLPLVWDYLYPNRQ